MNRAQLVEILASKSELSKTAANAVLETLIETGSSQKTENKAR
ncbi:MAG: hypothetical protein RR729_04305 [Comamonas sp.]